MRALVATALLAAVLHASSARAAGLYVVGIGGPGLGRAGADIVNPGDFGVLWYNPAALASTEGIQVFAELTLVKSRMYFDRLDDPTIFDTNGGVFDPVRNEAGLFLIPQLGFTARITDGVGIGFGFYAPHAGVYDFPLLDHDDDPDTSPLGPARYMVIASDSGQTFVELALGARITKRIEVGISAGVSTVFVNEKFAVHGSLAPDEDPGSDAILTVKALDPVTPSLGLGIRWFPVDGLTLALSGRTPVNVYARGTFELEPGPNLALLGVEVEGEEVTVSFHMPLILRLAGGYAAKNGLWDAEVALVWENWGSIGPVNIDASDVTVSSIVGDDPIGALPVDRGLRNALSVRAGGRIRLIRDHLWLQLGAAYESSGVTRALRSPSTNDPGKVIFAGGLTGKLWLLSLTVSYQRIQLFTATIDDSENEQLNALTEDAVTITGNGVYRGAYDIVSISLGFALDGLIRKKR